MKNLCYNPFLGLDINTQGEMKPCCKFLGNKMPTFNVENGVKEYQQSEWLSNLQKEFLDGKRPVGCQNCWKEEDSGVKSKRQLDYIRHKEKFDQVDLKKTEFKNIRIDFGNLCNLACRICHPDQSSKLGTELAKLDGKRYPLYTWHKNKKIMEDIFQSTKNAIHFDFAGGEPLLVETKEHFEFLNRLRDVSKISLHYTTNGTTYLKQNHLNIWKDFKEVDIQISVDDIEHRFEYNRWPAKWPKVYSNIKKYQQLIKEADNIKLSLSYTVSAFTIYYVNDFVEWCYKEKLPKPWLGIVSFPSHYKPSVFKKSVRNKIKEHLLKSKSTEVRNLSKYLEYDDSDNFSHFEEWTKKLDRSRSQNFSETFPELYELIY